MWLSTPHNQAYGRVLRLCEPHSCVPGRVTHCSTNWSHMGKVVLRLELVSTAGARSSFYLSFKYRIPNSSIRLLKMSDNEKGETNKVNRNILATNWGASLSISIPQMNETEVKSIASTSRTCLVETPPLPTTELSRRIPVDKVRKFGTEEFRGSTEDNPFKAEYWLENTRSIFDEMACPLEVLGLLPIHRWTSIGRTQDEKTLKKLQNSAGRVGSSTDTTLGSTDTIRTSIGRTHCSKQCSFGLGLLSIILPGLLIP
ncbi:hypothetical protein Gohar_016850 [Gossypium harknessii]|uniref:Uncharacterized protein n=1 Tax=Gossypium harknessii TaxID=34285 RepID=A0A7J9G475_9ROSI|nr:hypothetical protein [Gossypium harknessii]